MKDLTDLTTQCIRCGFCLESCPTFVLTGQETESPRGRIYLARSAEEGKISWQDARPHLECCVGCYACMTACPSGVQYGEIMEIARDRIESESPHRSKKAFLAGLTNPAVLKFQLAAGKLMPGHRVPGLVSKLLSGESPEADRPRAQPKGTLPPLDESKLPEIKGEVYVLEGCIMQVLFPRVHEATRRLLRRIGYAVREAEQGCCGSLHLHYGYLKEAQERAGKLVTDLPDDLPVILNSAGCGSTMKFYGELLSGASDAETFARRVCDASEFLLQNGLLEELQDAPGVNETATYHDACHLAHGQGIRSQPRELLAAIPGLTLVPLNEPDMCCGSAGIYNVVQPKTARELVERKMDNIEATGARIVVMGNPGCHAWIAQAAREHGGTVKVLHTVELLEAAFSGLEPFLV
jgi:glycolate oxidase iron-sulfur subunit